MATIRNPGADPAPPGARSGGEVLVAALAAHGVDRIFGVPGESVLPVFEALRTRRGALDFVTCRHEASAGQMAEADAKITGRPGVLIVSRGPGAMHGAIGLHTAFQDSTPLLMIVGQVPRDHRGREAFQEMEFDRVFAPMSKWAVEISSAALIPEYVRRALHIARAGRPGPVVLAVPEDVLEEMTDAPDAPAQHSPEPDLAVGRVDALLERLAQASRPLAVVGGGGWTEEAAKTVADFLEKSGVPVAAAFRNQDLVDNRAPHYIGDLSLGQNPALAERVAEADCLLVVGDRFGDVASRGYQSVAAPSPKASFIHVHPDPVELGRVFQTDLPILATPVGFARALSRAEPLEGARWSDWLHRCRAAYEAFHAPGPETPGLDLSRVMTHLRARLPDDAIVTNGAGNYNIWLHRYFSYRRFGTQIAPKAGTMGYGVPAAIAAKLRHPGRTVVALAGDGCFSMAIPELATALQNRLAITIVVVNNARYGSIRMWQERLYPGRPYGTSLENPDFVALIESYGGLGRRVERHEDFPRALEEALGSGRLSLVELIVDPDRLSPDFSLEKEAGHAAC